MKRFNLNGRYEYCPNGNYWQDATYIFDKKVYLFCACDKCKGKVYELRPVDITKKTSKSFIEKCRKMNELEKTRSNINLDNINDVKKLLNNLTSRQSPFITLFILLYLSFN